MPQGICLCSSLEVYMQESYYQNEVLLYWFRSRCNVQLSSGKPKEVLLQFLIIACKASRTQCLYSYGRYWYRINMKVTYGQGIDVWLQVQVSGMNWCYRSECLKVYYFIVANTCWCSRDILICAYEIVGCYLYFSRYQLLVAQFRCSVTNQWLLQGKRKVHLQALCFNLMVVTISISEMKHRYMQVATSKQQVLQSLPKWVLSVLMVLVHSSCSQHKLFVQVSFIGCLYLYQLDQGLAWLCRHVVSLSLYV